MAKVSHSSNLNKCRQCQEPLDVYQPPEDQFCCEDCREQEAEDGGQFGMGA